MASEYHTGEKHGGRIDSLGIDENGCPVIIEYKRATNENVINQGLYYLDWLLDHRGEFQLLVMQKYGDETSEEIDWSAPRLLCIAGGFTKYDEHAVQQMNRYIDLIRYIRFGEDLLLFELVNASTADALSSPAPSVASSNKNTYKTVSEQLDEVDTPLRDLYDEIAAYVRALGDDVQEKHLKYYIAFKRFQNFICIEIHPNKGCITTFVKVDPSTVELGEDFTRDVTNIGHHGQGNLEITIRNRSDFQKAIPLLQQSYEAS